MISPRAAAPRPLTVPGVRPRSGVGYLDAAAIGADGAGYVFAATDDRAAAAALVQLARRAAAACPTGELDVEVLGDGVVADLVRRLRPTAGSDGAPHAVVDTTGDPDRLDDAVRRLRPLGILVLAGTLEERVWNIDLYPDVHKRGLVLRGIAGPHPYNDDGRDPLVTDTLGRLVTIHEGEIPPAGFSWARVVLEPS